jgi:hypothetical protein
MSPAPAGTSCRFVTPAPAFAGGKLAGVQCLPVTTCSHEAWIPAFAGMTARAYALLHGMVANVDALEDESLTLGRHPGPGLRRGKLAGVQCLPSPRAHMKSGFRLSPE